MTAVEVGDPVTADLLDLMLNPPVCRLVQQAAQSIATANTALTFGAGSEDIDTHGFHDTTTNNTRITPNVAGYYEITGTYASAATTATFLALTPGKNGGTVAPRVQPWYTTTSGVKTVSVSARVSANGTTDYFEMFAINQAGGINTQAGGGYSCVFECQFIRPI